MNTDLNIKQTLLIIHNCDYGEFDKEKLILQDSARNTNFEQPILVTYEDFFKSNDKHQQGYDMVIFMSPSVGSCSKTGLILEGFTLLDHIVKFGIVHSSGTVLFSYYTELIPLKEKIFKCEYVELTIASIEIQTATSSQWISAMFMLNIFAESTDLSDPESAIYQFNRFVTKLPGVDNVVRFCDGHKCSIVYPCTELEVIEAHEPKHVSVGLNFLNSRLIRILTPRQVLAIHSSSQNELQKKIA